jgi:erythronate-4-phosphate dehydrogenase
MKIIADDKIPFLKGVLEPVADVIYLPGQAISRDHLKDADALLIRTRTYCNDQLLKDTPVKFIGTATIGYDHIDTAWCESQGITWKNAPGCNASSVAQYMASTLISLSIRFGISLKNRTLGVVGVGHVGSKVVHLAELLGMRVYLCDPPRVRKEGVCGFISLEGIIRECNIISFHVPLELNGQDKTQHMINGDLLGRVNPGTIIINTSRGEVADDESLKQAWKHGKITGLVLDVWEHEPHIDWELLKITTLATPHIAGYSADGKAKGTTMIVRELSRHFGLGLDDWKVQSMPQPLDPELRLDAESLTSEALIAAAVLHSYRVADDDRKLREVPENFEMLRGNYPPRREFPAYTLLLDHATPELKRTCRNIGFKVP